MLVNIIEITDIPNVFYDESKESLIQSCKSDAQKDVKWATAKELTITLETFGSDMDEIYCEYKFTK